MKQKNKNNKTEKPKSNNYISSSRITEQESIITGIAGVLKSQLHTEMFKGVTVIQNPLPITSTLVPAQAFM